MKSQQFIDNSSKSSHCDGVNSILPPCVPTTGYALVHYFFPTLDVNSGVVGFTRCTILQRLRGIFGVIRLFYWDFLFSVCLYKRNFDFKKFFRGRRLEF